MIYDFRPPSLTSLYSQQCDHNMIAWRALGAADKAAHILQILCRNRSSQPMGSVLEVGCGTGAVLNSLAESGIADRLVGIDIDEDWSNTANEENLQTKVQIHSYDGIKIPYPDAHFDLVYATHVLEHVINEREFLYELRRVARRLVYVEVPCELHTRTSFESLQSTLNIGHINSYTPASFALKLATSGLKVVKMDLFDHSFAVHVFRSSRLKAALKLVIRRSMLQLSKSLASRLFTYHCGALCEKSPLLDISLTSDRVTYY